MSNEPLDPPRQSWETAQYEDDPFELGDIDVTKLKRVSKIFLPSPDQLVFKNEPETEKISITLDKSDVDFFRRKATELGASYQRMIRNLLKMYVEQQREQDKKLSI